MPFFPFFPLASKLQKIKQAAAAAAAAAPSRRADIGIGVVDAAGQRGKVIFSTSSEVVDSLKTRAVSSANTIWGMPALLESEDPDDNAGDGLV